MGDNALLFAWNRSVPGREKLSAEHFQQVVAYLGELQKNGTIQSFDTVFLEPHGGDLNGFFLIRGEPARLDDLVASDEWQTHVTRAMLHLQGLGTVRGVTAEAIAERMSRWTSNIPV